SMSRLYINLGTKQGLNPNRLLGMINETVQDRSVRIGEIEVLRSFTFFEVNQRHAANVVKAFEGKYAGDRIKVDMAEGKITPRPTVRKKKPRTESRNKFQKDNS
ncbi:DbpA RNA binding domain-containing protein, partial [bacterium]|nr:DbpA RNA binding domain-containing protein [bacterium]